MCVVCFCACVCVFFVCLCVCVGGGGGLYACVSRASARVRVCALAHCVEVPHTSHYLVPSERGHVFETYANYGPLSRFAGAAPGTEGGPCTPLLGPYWAAQVGLLTPLTFARHRLSPLAAFTSGCGLLHFFFLPTNSQSSGQPKNAAKTLFSPPSIPFPR